MIYCIKNVVLTLTLSIVLMGNANASSMTFDPSVMTVNKFDEFSVNIIGIDFAELFGGDSIGLKFDGSIIEVTGVSIDSHFDFDPISGSRSSLNEWEGISIDTFVNEPANGDFTIATVTLKALEAGVSSLDFLDNANFYSTTATLSPTMSSTQITVNAVPVPPAVFLLGSGVIGLFSFFRKKKTN